jgi:L-rhamnono-1,4-lactonase
MDDLAVMATTPIIDSHIHLWPASAANQNGYSWMTSGHSLAKEHILSDYDKASTVDGSDSFKTEVRGVVYVETDRRVGEPSGALSAWAKGPLDEVRFLKAIVEGQYGEQDSRKLLGIVLWAPMDQPLAVLEDWLSLAEKTAGPKTWKRVKGFRFLLQAIHDEQVFRNLVTSTDFIQNLKLLGARGFSFDVGVDAHSGGPWQLEIMFRTMQLAHRYVAEDEKITFILNHLCKPDFSSRDSSRATPTASMYADPGYKDISFSRWSEAIKNTSQCAKTYMKFSGAFSELPTRPTANAKNGVVKQILPWIPKVLDCFGPRRVMFGSDWPVCNVNGPDGQSAWILWVGVVQDLLTRFVPPEEHEYVWSKTAVEAYRLG